MWHEENIRSHSYHCQCDILKLADNRKEYLFIFKCCNHAFKPRASFIRVESMNHITKRQYLSQYQTTETSLSK